MILLANTWALVKKVFKDSFTERDGQSYCAGRIFGATVGGGASVACVIKFLQSSTPDFIAFGTAVTAIITAVVGTIAAKNLTERGGP